jgi:hypothetical protein
MRPDLAFMAVDQIDKAKRTVVFVLGGDGAPDFAKSAASVKALEGTDVFVAGSDMRVGKVIKTERRAALRRSFVTVRVDDANAWAKVHASVFHGAQAKVYDGALGSLNLTDRPHENATALRKALGLSGAPATADPLAKLNDAIAKAWTRLDENKAVLAETDAKIADLRKRLDNFVEVDGRWLTVAEARYEAAMATFRAANPDTCARPH